MAQSASDGTFGARLLIIAFALGMVVLGIYPIRGDIRDVASRTRLFVRKHLPILAGETRFPEDSRRSARGSENATFLNSNRSPRTQEVIVEQQAEKKPQLDRLTPQDRKQLHDLVNSF